MGTKNLNDLVNALCMKRRDTPDDAIYLVESQGFSNRLLYFLDTFQNVSLTCR